MRGAILDWMVSKQLHKMMFELRIKVITSSSDLV